MPEPDRQRKYQPHRYRGTGSVGVYAYARNACSCSWHQKQGPVVPHTEVSQHQIAMAAQCTSVLYNRTELRCGSDKAQIGRSCAERTPQVRKIRSEPLCFGPE